MIKLGITGDDGERERGREMRGWGGIEGRTGGKRTRGVSLIGMGSKLPREA